MKNLIPIFILILFFSCATKKVLQQSRLDEKVTQQNAITAVKTDKSRATISEEGKTADSTQTITKTTKYDTTKPIQPETGKPPVSEETTTVQVVVGNRVMSQTIVTANDVKSDSTDNSKIQTSTKEENKVVEIPKPPAVKYYFYILITLVVLAGGYFVYRNFAKIKAFFGLIS